MRRLIVALLLAWSATADADTLRPFDAASWHAILAAHAGQPTLVHFWAMTCGPCRVEMPKLGALLARHPGIAAVTVDTDVVGVPGAAETFLARSGLRTEAWRFADTYTEKLYFSVDPAWQGEIPHTILIERDGRSTVIDGGDEAAIEAWASRLGAD